MLGGRILQVGTMCLVSPALLHRDPRWWAEPEQFRPDRWVRRVPGKVDRFDPKAPGQPRGAYLPFGAGPRMCIGEQFAWSEATTMLAELGRTWRLRVHDAPLAAGRSSMTLRPKRSRARDDVTASNVSLFGAHEDHSVRRLRHMQSRRRRWEAMPAALLVSVREPPGRVEPAAGVGQGVHGVSLPGLCFGEMPLRGDLVPSRFYPLGVERAQPCRRRPPPPPRRLRGRTRTASARPQRRQVLPRPGAAGKVLPRHLAGAGPESSSSANAARRSHRRARRPSDRPRHAAGLPARPRPQAALAQPLPLATSACCSSVAASSSPVLTRGRRPKPLCESGRTRRPLRMVSAPARSTRAA